MDTTNFYIIEELCHFLLPKEYSLENPESTCFYSPLPYTNSGLIYLKSRAELGHENSLLLKVVLDRQRSQFRADDPYKAEIILSDNQFHVFEFPNEQDYWRFVSGLRASGSMGLSLEGSCQLVSDKKTPDDQKPSRFQFFHSTGSAQVMSQFRFVNGSLQIFRSSKNDTSMVTITLSDVIGATVSHDFGEPLAHILQLRMPLKESSEQTRFAVAVSTSASDSLASSSAGIAGSSIFFSSPEFACGEKDAVQFSVPVDASNLTDFITRQWQLKLYDVSAVNTQSRQEQTLVAEDVARQGRVVAGGTFSLTFEGSPMRSVVESLNNVLDAQTIYTHLNPTDKICLNSCSSHFEIAPQRLLNKALRVSISSASGLQMTGSSIPSAYCTCYLVGNNDARLTSNHAEVRTTPVKSCDPVWDKVILLQDSDLGVSQVHAVMILLRDASSGIMKHRHIGQVTVPIACFLEDDEAKFSLPLEPSYRMDENLTERAFIGEIHISTKIVAVESAAAESSTSKSSGWTGRSSADKNAQLVLKEKESKPSVMHSSALLFRYSALACWHPCRRLANGEQGFLKLSHHGLLLRLNSPSAKDDSDGVQIFSMEQIDSFCSVTSTTVLVSLFVPATLFDGKNDRLLLLIGPCHADLVVAALHFRVENVHCSMLLEQMLSWHGGRTRTSSTFSPPKKVRSERRLSSQTSISALDVSISAGASSPIGMTMTRDSALMAAMEAALVLEQRCGEIACRKLTAEESNQYCSWEMRFVEFAYRLVTKTVFALDQHSPANTEDREAVNVELVDWIARRAAFFECDCEWLNELLDIIRLVVAHVRNMVFTTNIDSAAVKQKLQTRLLNYLSSNHKAMVSTLDSFVASKAEFDRIPSIEFKWALTRLAVRSNMRLEYDVRTILALSHTSIEVGKLPLFADVDALIGWFVIGVASEIKKWVTKTLHASTNGRNPQSLPWEVEKVGNEVTSHLPVSFQMQLDVFHGLMLSENWANDAQEMFTSAELQFLRERIRKANEDIDNILLHSWILVVHEFERVLQSRHWDEASTAQEQTLFVNFLCAVVNDLCQIRDKHHAIPIVAQEIESVVSKAINKLLRVVFADTMESILDFDTKWFDLDSKVCQLLLQNVVSHVKHVQSICSPASTDQFSNECLTVLVLRLFLMFKSHLASNHALSPEETNQLRKDTEQFASIAQQLLSDIAFANCIPLQYLMNFVHIVVEDPESSAFNTSLLWILRQFDLTDKDQRMFVELLLLSCALPLRCDADAAYRYIFGILDTPNGDKGKYAEHISFAAISNNLYFRAFGDLLFPPSDGNGKPSGSGVAQAASVMQSLKQMQPASALKVLRQKASDSVVSWKNQYRQNEDAALHLMRVLSLENDPNQLKPVVRNNDILLKFFGEAPEEVERSQKRPSIKALLDGLLDQQPVPGHGAKGRIVEITAVAVRGLQSFSVLGEANPYVYFSVGESKTKTSVKWNHCDAQWDEVLSLQVSSVELMTENLLVEVYDKERIRRKRLMGMVAIKLQSFSVNSSGSWYALEGGDKSSYGEVHLRVVVK